MSGIARRVDPASAGFVVAINPGVLKPVRMREALLSFGRTWAFSLAQSPKLTGGSTMKHSSRASKQLQTIPTRNHHTIFSFSNHDIRTVKDKQGGSWWIAVDVCNILNLASVTTAINRLQNNEKGITANSDTLGRHFVVSDMGLYRLIAKSHKPEVASLLRWVIRELFPNVENVYILRRNRIAA